MRSIAPLHPLVRHALAALPLALLAGLGAEPLDTRVTYARHEALTIADRGQAVVVTLAPEDGDLLRAQAGKVTPSGLDVPNSVPDYAADPLGWRAIHARLIQALTAAGARVVAFDVFFAAPAPERSQELAGALTAARRHGTRVILGHHFERRLDHALYDADLCSSAVLLAERDGWMDTLKRMALLSDFDDGSPHMPSLFVQAYALASTGREALVTENKVTAPEGLPESAWMWLRYAATAPTMVRYSDVLLLPADVLARRVHGKAVFVGLTGSWAESDVHPVPFVPQGQPRVGPQETYGLFVQAHAFNQLVARDFVTEPSSAQRVGLIFLAFALGGLPAILGGLRARNPAQLFQAARTGGPGLRTLGRWPWPALLGAGVVAAVNLALWGCPLFYPVAGTMAAGTVGAVVMSLPGLGARRRAIRLVRALAQVDAATRRAGLQPVVRIPPGGPADLIAVLAGPALDTEGTRATVEALHGAIGEAAAGKTYFQRLPRAFFRAHGWLDSGTDGPVDAGGAELLARADELTEAFCGTRLRRIRNLWNHTELSGHAAKLGHDALSAGGRDARWAGAADNLRLQQELVTSATAYLLAVADWIEPQQRR